MSQSPEGPRFSFHRRHRRFEVSLQESGSQSPEGARFSFHGFPWQKPTIAWSVMSQSPEGSRFSFHRVLPEPSRACRKKMSQSPEGSRFSFHTHDTASADMRSDRGVAIPRRVPLQFPPSIGMRSCYSSSSILSQSPEGSRFSFHPADGQPAAGNNG